MEPPNLAAIDMRHTKLKASEAALLAGELVKPTWASRNEGIHERVSFEDTLWGFEMAGGAFYKTPLRVAYVRPGSRAEHACIRMGDTVLRINGQDTSNLTLQEAHQLVLEAGINLKIAVTSPDDKVNAHYDYEDPLMDTSGPSAEELKQMEIERVRKALERAARCRDLPWPWVRRNWVIYKESNCFMVPSKYENNHREKFPELPAEKLNYFYPVDNKNPVKNNSKPMKNNEITKNEEEEEDQYEEVEEDDVEDEHINKQEKVTNHYEEDANEKNTSERLEGTANIEESIEQAHISLSQENMETNNIESGSVDNLENVSSADSQRKKSDQSSVSNYEVDNNNNHVVKQKDDQIDEETEENYSNDRIINEIAENLVDLQESKAKSDDDIIESVLNEDTELDLQNER